MKKSILIIISFFLVLSCTNKKPTKTLVQEFDYYIENEDYEGIKKLNGKYFTYENCRKNNFRFSFQSILQ